MRDEMYAEIVRFMEEDPSRIHPGIDHLFVARGLERLADHATNIAEDVLFFVQGIDVRHHADEGISVTVTITPKFDRVIRIRACSRIWELW